MKIFVISLLNSESRRIRIANQLAGKGIEFEFLDAIDGRTSNHPYLQNYNEPAFLINRRRKAALGELGCYVSHLIAWEKCLELNEPIVVLEDDCELTENFIDGVNFIANFTDKMSFIRLEPLESKMFLTSYKGVSFSLVKQLKISMRATGYVVTPTGAKNFLNKGKIICCPIDLYLKNSFLHKQSMYALIPPVVYTTNADSIIGHDTRGLREHGLTLHLKRFVFKWFYILMNTVTTLTNGHVKF